MEKKRIRLTPETWEKIFEHARKDYPAECCGMVTEQADGGLRVHPCDNIQDRLHARDPKGHPRTSREAYRMDDLQVQRTLEAADRSGGRLKAFYHSHIDCPAYFSKEDKNAATPFGEPLFPDVVYLVVSVVDEQVRAQKGFCWDPAAKDFVETPLDI